MDGGVYLAPPVVVFDTSNACIETDNINDNSEVSRIISALRNSFRDIPLVLIGHTSKASRSQGRKQSMVGAGSWEGDTQQSLYVVQESGSRYLELGKRRFETIYSGYRLEGRKSDFTATNELGQQIAVSCFYSWPVAQTDDDKKRRQEVDAREKQSFKKHQILEFVSESPGCLQREVTESVGGNKSNTIAAIEACVKDELIYIEDGPNRSKRHYIGQPRKVAEELSVPF